MSVDTKIPATSFDGGSMFEPDDQGPFDFAAGRLNRRESPIPADEPREPVAPPTLDSPDMLRQHEVLLGLYRRELDRQFYNRLEQATDEDFYDHIQWDEKDAATLRDRGQMPLVYNVIATGINWVLGTQLRQRTDYKVLPRRKGEGQAAERKTALLKYLSDVNHSQHSLSAAFADATKVGIGWLECGVEDAATGDPVYDRAETWRNMLWDSAASKDDLSDARYLTRSKWVDADILRAVFHERAQLIGESIDTTNVYETGIEADGDQPMDEREIENQQSGLLHGTLLGIDRPRVRTIEMWFRRPVMSYRMRGGSFAGDLYDFSDAHDAEILSGRAIVERKPIMRIHCALMTNRGFLWYGPSPYRHNRFPFTPIWGFRRGRDGMPYGLIRGLRDIQIDINKRASKALFILSSNKVVMDENALPDDISMKEFEDEVARPDAIIRKRPGTQMLLNADRDLAQAHIQLMSRSIQFIQSQSGITDENLGKETNAASGVAIGRRQDQGSIATVSLFDRLRYAMQLHGEKELSLIEQYYSEQKDFRITGTRGPEYVSINTGLPHDDITATKADFVLSESDWHATLRQAAVESLVKAVRLLMPGAPQVALAMIDLIVENMDIPNRAEIVARIRAATGMPDPGAETPSQEQAAAAQKRQIKEQLELATAQADLRLKQAAAAKAGAQAGQAQAQAMRLMAQVKTLLSQVVDKGVTTQQHAIEAALKLLEGDGASSAGPVADQLLTEAGFIGAPAQRAMQERIAALRARQAQGAQPGIRPQSQQPPSPPQALPAQTPPAQIPRPTQAPRSAQMPAPTAEPPIQQTSVSQ